MSHTLTPQSQAVAEAIYNEQDLGGGIGASLQEICKATGLSPKIVRGNLGDLFKKGIIDIDFAKDSGASCDLYYHNDWSE